MGSSNALSKLYKAILPFTDFIWILQKEEYDPGRYAHWLKRFFFRRNFVVSEKFVPTNRARIVVLVSDALWLGCTILGELAAPNVLAQLAVILVGLALIPVFVYLAALVTLPLFRYAHARLRMRAAALIAKQSSLTIVAVAGSYGKTTTKNFIYDLVRYHHRTQLIPGNINTPPGIAEWVLKNLSPNTEVLIVEMDAYRRGEIAASAQVAPPTITVVTNIGDQHLERFGTKAKLAAALGELVTHSKDTAVVVGDAETLAQLPKKATATFLTVNTAALTYENQAVEAPHLSSSNKENLSRALVVAEQLAIPTAFVLDTARALTLPDQRQKLTTLFGYDAIDDSYNISLSTAKAGIAAAKAAAHIKNKKLLVITAGIPEVGPHEREGNEELGKVIAASADHAIVLKTIFAKEIEKGIGDPVRYTEYKRLDAFLKDTHAKFPAREWFLLLQPALPDLYY